MSRLPPVTFVPFTLDYDNLLEDIFNNYLFSLSTVRGEGGEYVTEEYVSYVGMIQPAWYLPIGTKASLIGRFDLQHHFHPDYDYNDETRSTDVILDHVLSADPLNEKWWVHSAYVRDYLHTKVEEMNTITAHGIEILDDNKKRSWDMSNKIKSIENKFHKAFDRYYHVGTNPVHVDIVFYLELFLKQIRFMYFLTLLSFQYYTVVSDYYHDYHSFPKLMYIKLYESRLDASIDRDLQEDPTQSYGFLYLHDEERDSWITSTKDLERLVYYYTHYAYLGDRIKADEQLVDIRTILSNLPMDVYYRDTSIDEKIENLISIVMEYLEYSNQEPNFENFTSEEYNKHSYAGRAIFQRIYIDSF